VPPNPGWAYRHSRQHWGTLWFLAVVHWVQRYRILYRIHCRIQCYIVASAMCSVPYHWTWLLRPFPPWDWWVSFCLPLPAQKGQYFSSYLSMLEKCVARILSRYYVPCIHRNLGGTFRKVLGYCGSVWPHVF
jgi:hypothetical protein